MQQKLILKMWNTLILQTLILSIFENCKNYLVRVILPQFYFHGPFSLYSHWCEECKFFNLTGRIFIWFKKTHCFCEIFVEFMLSKRRCCRMDKLGQKSFNINFWEWLINPKKGVQSCSIKNLLKRKQMRFRNNRSW